MITPRIIPSAARRTAGILLMAATLALPAAHPEVFISVGFAPPALPVYAQPICPGDGYIWTPGYWAYGPEGYFWVPGTWVRPPQIGYLWTPAYWGWGGNAYIFHAGYWGPHIGFYGGINYGFGYGGLGYEGGYWRGSTFFYNRSVNNINAGYVHNVYEHPVIVRNAAYTHVSYNGGNGGIPYRASPQELAAVRERHVQPTGEQLQHQNFAAQNRDQFANVNRGHPSIAAAPTPSAFRSNPAVRGGFGNNNGFNGPQRGNPAANSAARPMPPQQGRPQFYNQNRTPNAAPRPAYNQPEYRQQIQPQQQPRQPMQQPGPQMQPRLQMQPRPQMESRPAPAPRAENRPAGGEGHPGRH